MKLLAVLGLAALLLVACSKGGAPSKAQYTAVADSVCTTAHDDLQKKTTEHLKTKPDGGANQRFVRATLIARLRGMVGELKGIPRPETDGPYLESVYADYDHAMALRYADPLGESSTPARKAAEARMKSYGMAACSTAADISLSKSG